MKKDNLIKSYALTLMLIVFGLIVGQIFVNQAIRVNENDNELIKQAQKQATLSEQISKGVALMYVEKINKVYGNFDRVKKGINSSLNEMVYIQKQIDENGEKTGRANSDAVNKIIKSQERHYKEIRDAAKEALTLDFSDSKEEKKIVLTRVMNSLLDNQSKMTRFSQNLADQFELEAKENKQASILFGYIVTLIVVVILIIQAFFTFRPAVNLAYKNFQSSNVAYMKLKKSENELRISAEKQLAINEKLLISQRSVEQQNQKLRISEREILKSSKKQLLINEKLVKVQDELRKTYDTVKNSEERMRVIAEEQLEATEKLMIAENKLKLALDHEKEGKEELSMTLNNLKSTQSQLIQSEKMASLGQLTAGIAHEINNPINFVYNGIDTLKVSLDDLMTIVDKYEDLDKTDDYVTVINEIKELKEEYSYTDLLEDLKDLVSDIKNGAVRTIEIVKGLRVFSRLDEEEMKMANVNDAIDATLILLRNKTKHLISITKFYDEEMKEINCFPGQLNQVFMNIINNAIQAIPEEKEDKEIQIFTESQDQNVIIKIKDNGSGMSEQVKRRIFEPFFTTKPVGIGTGLGMSITFGIIEKHGGSMSVESQENIGTEFTIVIPKHLSES